MLDGACALTHTTHHHPQGCQHHCPATPTMSPTCPLPSLMPPLHPCSQPQDTPSPSPSSSIPSSSMPPPSPPLTVAGRLVRQDVGHTHQRPPRQPALHLVLDAVRQRQHPLHAQLRLGRLVQRALKEWHRQHAPQRKHGVGVGGALVRLNQRPGQRSALAGACVAAQPCGVARKRVQELGRVGEGVGYGDGVRGGGEGAG